MHEVILVIHLLLAIAMVIVVLLQRSEGGALGIGGGTAGGLMTGRSAANLLTRATAVLAACFMATSIVLSILAGGHDGGSILDAAPVEAPAPNQPAEPAKPLVPQPE